MRYWVPICLFFTAELVSNGQGLKWKFETGNFVLSNPAIGKDGIVYFGSGDHKVYALRGQTGDKIWEFNTGSVAYSPSIGSDGTVYIGSWDRKIYAK